MVHRLLLGTFLILSSWGFTCQAEQQLHISTGFTPPVSDFFKSVLVEVDKRMNEVSISFEVLPAERSLVLVNQGRNDAECCRIPNVVLGEYKNLITIDESFYAARFSAFGKNSKAEIKQFSDLKPYSVGTVKGWKIAVNKLKQVEPAHLFIVTTPSQMMEMINQGRIDYGVVGYLSGLESIGKLGLSNSVSVIEPPLVEKDLFMVLHKKHADLKPAFNKVLAEMKRDGTIERIYSELIQTMR